MNKTLFKELTQSIKEAGQIQRGKRRPARQRHINALGAFRRGLAYRKTGSRG